VHKHDNLRTPVTFCPPGCHPGIRVQTNSYNAEFGRYAADHQRASSPAPTSFIRLAFEFLRNTLFNANDWGSTLARAPFHRNQFWRHSRCPIKKDRAFFFAPTRDCARDQHIPERRPVPPAWNASALHGLPQLSHRSCHQRTFVLQRRHERICPNRQDPVAVKIIMGFISYVQR